MILQALMKYYEALVKRGELSAPGWSRIRISYALELSADGRPVALHSLKQEVVSGKKTKQIPREMVLPAAVKRTSGISANFLWENSTYILGFDGNGKPERSADCFRAARELHLSLLEGIDTEAARTICEYYRSWDVNTAMEHPVLQEAMKELLSGANIVFMVNGGFPQEDSEIARAWQKRYNNDEEAGNAMRCLVTGESVQPIAVHPTIKGVRDAQSSGAALVSFNLDSSRSYGREQSFNAPVGKYAAFAYTEALNYLIKGRGHNRLIGDTTTLFWAENAEDAYSNAMLALLDGDDNSIGDRDIAAVMDSLSRGEAVLWDDIPLQPDNRFCILGLAPNNARLSVRFFLRDSFGAMLRHTKEHFDRLEIVKDGRSRFTRLPLWALLQETVNENARDKASSPQMSVDTLRAIISGARYPTTLYRQLQLRIKADLRLSWEKASIIKAYLLRNTDNIIYKEVLSVELNETTSYQPYILGRIFSVLEAIQQCANPGINTTIKDKFFTSASATPTVVFPTLVNLADKHLRKLDPRMSVHYSKQLGELMSRITESYPTHMSLYDQGIFQIGYYHQTQKRYEKKNTANNGEV